MARHFARRCALPQRPVAPRARRHWQRQVAEIAKNWRREQRERRVGELAASEAALAHVRATARETTPDLDDLFAWLLADLDARRRITELVPVLEERAPDLLTSDLADALRRLVACAWVRSVGDWQPRGKGRDRRLQSLVDHLLVRFPVPRFLYRVFLGARQAGEPSAPCLDDGRLFAHLAAGGSVREAIARGWVPLPLTRRMSHLFLQAPPAASLVLAARLAQIGALGGPDWLAGALVAALDERSRPGSPSFWWEAAAWFCRQRDLAANQVGPLVDYLAHAASEDENYSLAGRTLGSVRRAMVAWHAELAQIRRLVGVRFEKSTKLEPGRWLRRTRVGEALQEELWTMDEILCSRELVREGTAMGHCVATYVDDVLAGASSIWSLRCDGQRALTVEVRPVRRLIDQARGKFNRQPRAVEKALLKRWARENGLEVGKWL